ncbi:MAG: DUF1461 domain-containing protein [Pseudomonadales bacterium]|nr:DUF1461 domain-containing protein [Pseudomonadales bacterium]
MSIAIWPLLFFAQLIVAGLLSWHLLSKFDFAYPTAYDAINIEKHINRFGPKNRFRPHFETTDKEQHLLLFAQIAQAIQHSGKGLADITYVTAQGQKIQLLRNAEVIHLQDVANLVDFFYGIGYVCIGLLLITAALAWHYKLAFPPLKNIALGISVLIAIVVLIIVIVGPKELFYWLHVQVFPPDHEWFFYYQESLMTTLMKAPDLFGFIGVVWGTLLVPLWVIEIIGIKLLLKVKA